MLKETAALKDLIFAHRDTILNDINFFIIETGSGEFFKNYLPNAEYTFRHKCVGVSFSNEFPFIEVKIEGIKESFYPEDVDIGIFASKNYYATMDEEEARNWSRSVRMYTAEGIQSDLEKRISNLEKEFNASVVELQEELEGINIYMQSIEDELKSEHKVTETENENFINCGTGI